MQLPACKASSRPQGWKLLSLRLAWNESTAHILMAFYLTSGECWYVLRYHFHWDSLKAFPQLCTLFRKWKFNLHIKDGEPQLSVSPQHMSRQSCFYFSFSFLFISYFFPFCMRNQVRWSRNDIFNKKDLWILSDPEMLGILQYSTLPLRTQKFCFIKYVFVISSMSRSLTNIQETCPSCWHELCS